jgi:hypothetical protein
MCDARESISCHNDISQFSPGGDAELAVNHAEAGVFVRQLVV